MTETLDPMAAEVDQKQLAEQLLAQAKEHGVELMGPNGLLNQLAKNVLALDAEMTEHLGYDRHDSADRGQRQTLETVPVENGLHRGLYRWRSAEIGVRGTSIPRSPRRSSRSDNAAWPVSTRSYCPCPQKE